jgi:hypothetical protein
LLIQTDKKFRCALLLVFMVSLIPLCFSCSTGLENSRKTLRQTADEINIMFVTARDRLDKLKMKYHSLLANEKNFDGLYSRERYTFSKDYVYFTPYDDGHCEIWASGHIPVGKAERQKIRQLERLCPELKTIYQQNDFIATVYLTTFDSIVMGYPYADIHAYMEHGLDLTEAWVTYRAAAGGENPERKTLWVPPYIDAVGRGYMTSVITPVYYGGVLEGTLGIDITVDIIVRRFEALSKKNRMIVTAETIPVSVNNNSVGILQINGLEKYNYLKKAPENKIIASSLMMSKSPRNEIQRIAEWIQSDNAEKVLSISGDRYRFYKVLIPEVEWFLIEFVKD